MKVTGAGSVGWGWGTPQWPDGEFFRYRTLGVEPVHDGEASAAATG